MSPRRTSLGEEGSGGHWHGWHGEAAGHSLRRTAASHSYSSEWVMGDIRGAGQCHQAAKRAGEGYREFLQHCRLSSTLRTRIYHSTLDELDMGILDQGSRGTGPHLSKPVRIGGRAVPAGPCGHFGCLALSLAICEYSAVCRLPCSGMDGTRWESSG